MRPWGGGQGEHRTLSRQSSHVTSCQRPGQPSGFPTFPPSLSPTPSKPVLEQERPAQTRSSLLQCGLGQKEACEWAAMPGDPGGQALRRPWGGEPAETRAVSEVGTHTPIPLLRWGAELAAWTHLFDGCPVLQDVDLLQHVHDIRACNQGQGSRKPRGGEGRVTTSTGVGEL